MGAEVVESRFRGTSALTLTSGDLVATFLPDLGMTGVSLQYRGVEHLALPGGLAALRAGATLGLPLLAPWANRLATRQYRAGGVSVDLRGLELTTDDNGLPMHGLLVGKPGWRIGRRGTRGDTTWLRAAIDVDAPAFPFPHRVELKVTARDARLTVGATVIPTGRRPVPIAFGWHPYLRLPTTGRSTWRLRLPTRHHLALDTRGIPTGASNPEPAEAAPIGRRTFDDLYRLGRRRRLALEVDGAAIELHCAENYPFAQVWVPPGRAFAALEPMAAPTNALVEGTTPFVPSGEAFTATFALTIT
ncbi:MAG TPA: aldose 1-epimerase [Acidimicrobiales bacterium]|nr:aldose 1-epimerase [Acidimicrobiales bacterium]